MNLRQAAEMALEGFRKYVTRHGYPCRSRAAHLGVQKQSCNPSTTPSTRPANRYEKGTKAWADVPNATEWVEELRGNTPDCKTHPDAPHGFDRNASHSADRYVCECEGWEPPKREWVGLTDDEIWDIGVDNQRKGGGFWGYPRAIEAKLKEKNT
jgi:hypothetical protein